MKSLGNVGAMTKNILALQKKMNDAQAELTAAEYTSEAGNGLVQVTLKGSGEIKRLDINKALLSEDPETVSDLVAAAVNRALKTRDEAAKERLKEIGAGVLPGGLRIPGF